MATITIPLGHHELDHTFALHDLPQALVQLAALVAELGAAEAVDQAAQDLEGDAALAGQGGAGEDGELGDGVAGAGGGVAVVVQALVGGDAEGFGGRDEGAGEGEAELGELVVVSVGVVGGFLVFFGGGVGMLSHKGNYTVG